MQAQGPVLLPEFLPSSIRADPLSGGASPPTETVDWEAFLEERLRSGSQDLYAEATELIERSLLTRVLRQTVGNQAQAAKILGITRGSLRTKVRALDIRIERSVWSTDDQLGR